MAHDLGNLAAHVKLADAVGIMVLAVFITGMLGIGWLRGFVGPEEGTNPDDNAEQNEMPAPNFHNVIPSAEPNHGASALMVLQVGGSSERSCRTLDLSFVDPLRVASSRKI